MPYTFPFSWFMGGHEAARQRRLDAYLQLAVQEAQSEHPESSPESLICPISQVLMKDPVYTPLGSVFDRNSIIFALTRKGQDPLTRAPLTPGDLRPFSQLLGPIQHFTERQKTYARKKTDLITAARQLAHTTTPVARETPPLFRCPIGKGPIRIPVITAEGDVYDKASLANYLKTSGGLDEKERNRTLQAAEYFEDFDAQLKWYEFRREQQERDRMTKVRHGLFRCPNPCKVFTNWFLGKSTQENEGNKPTFG